MSSKHAEPAAGSSAQQTVGNARWDAVVRDLRKHFAAYSSVSFDNYPVRDLPGAPLVGGGP